MSTNLIELFHPAPLTALSVVDSLARALRTSGEFPPPIGDIEMAVVAATAPVARTFDPPRKLHFFRNRSGYVVLDGTFTLAAEPHRRWPLAPGTYRVRVSGEFYQDTEFQLQWPLPAGARRVDVSPLPNDAGSVELLPSSNYPVPDPSVGRLQLGPTILRGTALAADGTPLAGIRAEVINLPFLAPGNLPPLGDWPFTAATTNAHGDWTLVLPDRRYFDATPEIPPGSPPQVVTKQLGFRVAYPDGAVVRQANVRLGSEFSLRNTMLRGQVVDASGRPIAGATVESTVNARTSRTRADGVWILCFDLNQATVPNVTVTITTPTGATASANTTLQREATVVVPTFQFP